MKFLLLSLAVTIFILTSSHISKQSAYATYHTDDVDQVFNALGPPAAKTGAPGENTCTQCHAGIAQSAAGTINYAFSDAQNHYLPGTSYTINLGIGSGSKNGFQLTILDDNNNAAGTFTAGSNTATSSSGGRNYIQQSSAAGIMEWTFTWNAPSSDLGDLTVYYAFNQSNSNNSTSSDIIYLGQETISISGSVGISDREALNDKFEVFVNAQSRELNISFFNESSSRTVVQIIDLSGKLVYAEDLGLTDSGEQQHLIDLSGVQKSGVYIVSLLLDNQVLNRQVMIPRL